METTHPSPAEIAKAIIKSFDSLPERLRAKNTKGDGAWTVQLKDDIGTLGEKHGWAVCAGGFKDRFDGGWLYDLVWYRNNEKGHLVEVYLVLESEWGNNTHIKYDFEKLHLAKSALKVMVFQTRSWKIEKLFEFLVEGIRAWPKQSTDETYLLIAYNIDTGNFDIRQFDGCGLSSKSSQ
jgi:hypothetical protein